MKGTSYESPGDLCAAGLLHQKLCDPVFIESLLLEFCRLPLETECTTSVLAECHSDDQ